MHRKGKWSLKDEKYIYNEKQYLRPLILFSRMTENTMDYILWKHNTKGKGWPNENDL